MNIHDEYIKKANKEIDRLTSDIEKKKVRIAELRSAIKTHEAEKTRDSEFSDKVMKLLSDNGVNSDDDRKAILAKFEDLMLEREIENDENSKITEINKSAEDPKTENFSAAKISENPVSTQNGFYQSPAYPYKPTNN